jgi:phenylacetate-CoA ligase
MAAAEHFDALETRAPEERERTLLAALPSFIAHAKAKAAGWAAHLKDIESGDVTSRAALARLPLLRKGELAERQKAAPPLGGFAAADAKFARYYMSPGAIFEPGGAAPDWWRLARAAHAAGFRAGDVVHNAFAYHLTPGGLMLDSGLAALGCVVVPAGVGNTEMQVDAMAQLRPAGFAGTPDFLKVLLDKAAELGRDLSSVTRALVSGGALFPALRQEYADRGVAVRQCYAIADLGLIAYESDAMQGMIVDEGVILEIVRPGTGDPVPDGEVGEVVVTSFNLDYPMIRLATGDLSAVLPGASPCGRSNTRIKGWMGRADQATKVKGMFVRPEQVALIARRHPALGRLRLVVTRTGDQDVMLLRAECADAGAADAVAGILADVTKIKGMVEIVAPGSLPNDGKVIEDARKYD